MATYLFLSTRANEYSTATLSFFIMHFSARPYWCHVHQYLPDTFGPALVTYVIFLTPGHYVSSSGNSVQLAKRMCQCCR